MYRKCPALLLALLCSGCLSLTSYQSPKVLNEGQVAVGGGAAGLIETGGEGGLGLLEMYGRAPLSPNVEAGLKITYPATLFADVKYQVMRAPLHVAADMGLSYFGPWYDDGDFDVATVGFYPMLLVGTERYYAGARLVVLTLGSRASDSDEEQLYAGTLPGLTAGATLGGQLQIRPELNLYYSTSGSEIVLAPGLGLQYTFDFGTE